MGIVTIGLDLAKNIFRFTALTEQAKRYCASNFAATRSKSSSRLCLLAWLEWKLVRRLTIGRAG